MSELADLIRDTMRQHEAALYEAGDPSLSPWPDDPDAGTLRYAAAIRAVLDLCEEGSWWDPDRVREVIASALGIPPARGYGIQP